MKKRFVLSGYFGFKNFGDEAILSVLVNHLKPLQNADITVFSSDLEENGIESIDEVELKFHIYNADSYDTIADSDAITFSAQ